MRYTPKLSAKEVDEQFCRDCGIGKKYERREPLTERDKRNCEGCWLYRRYGVFA